MEEDDEIEEFLDAPSFSAEAIQAAFEDYRKTVKQSGAEDEAAAAKLAITGVGTFFRGYMEECS
eukprot:15357348-Alexandrium_andersonii.AAC.1